MSSSTPSMPPPEKGRIRQLRQAYRITKRTDSNLGLILLFWFLLAGGAFGLLGYLTFGRSTFGLVMAIVFAIIVGILAVLIVFGRRAEKSAYLQMEGQAGAAAGALQMLRRGFEVKPAVAFNKSQDVVHRVVSRAGVVLVGEGQAGRVKPLLAGEVKKHARIVGEDVPVISILVGSGDGEVPLPKLTKHVRKLPKSIKPPVMAQAVNKVKALDSMRPQAPMPRGPMTQNLKGARKAMRG